MIRDLAIFLVTCAVIAGGTLIAGTVRKQNEQAARYATMLTKALNGVPFSVPGTVVLCYPTEVGGSELPPIRDPVAD